MAELGRPRDDSHYLQVQVQGVTVYVHKNLTPAAERGLTLRVDGLWRWRRLFVETNEEDDAQ